MQKVFFTVLVVVAVLVTIRLNNYPEQKDGLFANPASTDTLIPDAESPDIATTDDDTAEKENDEADTGFKEVLAKQSFFAAAYLLFNVKEPTFLCRKSMNAFYFYNRRPYYHA